MSAAAVPRSQLLLWQLEVLELERHQAVLAVEAVCLGVGLGSDGLEDAFSDGATGASNAGVFDVGRLDLLAELDEWEQGLGDETLGQDVVGSFLVESFGDLVLALLGVLGLRAVDEVGHEAAYFAGHVEVELEHEGVALVLSASECLETLLSGDGLEAVHDSGPRLLLVVCREWWARVLRRRGRDVCARGNGADSRLDVVCRKVLNGADVVAR